jgi:hypothetical protein
VAPRHVFHGILLSSLVDSCRSHRARPRFACSDSPSRGPAFVPRARTPPSSNVVLPDRAPDGGCEFLICSLSFAPLDAPRPDTVDVVTALLQNYNAPPTFLTERLQSVTHSYGSRKFNGNRYGNRYIPVALGRRDLQIPRGIASWFHFLCKNISVQTNLAGETRIVDPLPRSETSSQSDATWIKGGFYLTWGPGRGNETCTTLICFGAHFDLTQRFGYLASHPSWVDAVNSPFNLFLIVLDELFLVLDNKVWDLSDVFRTMEMVSECTQSAGRLE